MRLSPFRRVPWKELPFNCPKVRLAHERNQRPRERPEDHYDSFKEDDQRGRTSAFSRDRSQGHQRLTNQEDFYHQRLSPPRHGGRGGGESGMFDFRRRSTPPSPLRLPRELLPPTPQQLYRRQQREAGPGWRREEPHRDQDRFRDPSPGSDHTGWGRNPAGSYREKQRGEGGREKSPPLNRSRREVENGGHSG